MSRAHAAACLGFVLAVGACTSDGTEPEPEPLPAGLLILAGTDTLVRVQGSSVSSGLVIPLADCTDELQIIFVDGDGVVLAVDNALMLDVQVEDTTVAAFQVDTTGAGRLCSRLTGATEGSSRMRVRLLRNAGEPRYESPWIQVVVVAPAATGRLRSWQLRESPASGE
ncbi:MAG: hypothetical protein ACRELD_13565 [Longimicrobiales bacterium]